MILFSWEYITGMIIGSIIFWMFVPAHLRAHFITLASMLSIGLFQPIFTSILIVLIIFVYLGAIRIQRGDKFAWVGMLILAIISILILAKYLFVYFEPLAGAVGFEKNYIVPLGISYLTLRLIDFIISVKRGVVKEISISNLFAYIMFLPTFPGGPIERYTKFIDDLKLSFNPERYFGGFLRIAIGFFKKIVLVDAILYSLLYTKIWPYVKAHTVWKDVPPEAAFAFILFTMLYAYIDLSSYADIAIGLGQLFGLQTCEDMNYPMFSQNISEFWKRWHMSLCMWCRNNVYFPALGLTRSKLISLYIAFMIMGVWHYFAVKWVLWGLWQATGIVIYSIWAKYLKKHISPYFPIPSSIGHALGATLTVIYVSFAYSVMMTDSLEQAHQILRGALFLNQPLFDMVL